MVIFLICLRQGSVFRCPLPLPRCGGRGPQQLHVLLQAGHCLHGPLPLPARPGRPGQDSRAQARLPQGSHSLTFPFVVIFHTTRLDYEKYHMINPKTVVVL